MLLSKTQFNRINKVFTWNLRSSNYALGEFCKEWSSSQGKILWEDFQRGESSQSPVVVHLPESGSGRETSCLPPRVLALLTAWTDDRPGPLINRAWGMPSSFDHRSIYNFRGVHPPQLDKENLRARRGVCHHVCLWDHPVGHGFPCRRCWHLNQAVLLFSSALLDCPK